MDLGKHLQKVNLQEVIYFPLWEGNARVFNKSIIQDKCIKYIVIKKIVHRNYRGLLHGDSSTTGDKVSIII